MEPQKTKDTTRAYYLLGFKIFADFGFSIAIPVVVLSRLGKFLDNARPVGDWPWWTIAGFVFAAVMSAFLIKQKAKKYAIEYQSIEDKTKI